MSLEFQTTSPADLDDVANALIAGFNGSPDAPYADRRLLHWKYFEAGPQWHSSRGYVLRQDGRIKAHCGVWPMNLEYRGQQITCISFVDWVSDRGLPGAGVLLKKKLMRLADTSIVVGGSIDTRAVVPRIGFAHVGDVDTFVCVVRPWKQYRTRPAEGPAKSAARLARNTAWRISSHAPSTNGWQAKPVNSFEAWVDQRHAHSFPMPIRSADYLNYWQRLPAAKVSGFSVLHDGNTCGYFLLSRVHGQTRIVDIRVWPDEEPNWKMAFGLARTMAEADPETCEILAIASTSFARHALHASGFRLRGGDPLFLYDPKGKLANAPPMFLNLIDGDGAYLYDPDYPYNT